MSSTQPHAPRPNPAALFLQTWKYRKAQRNFPQLSCTTADLVLKHQSELRQLRPHRAMLTKMLSRGHAQRQQLTSTSREVMAVDTHSSHQYKGFTGMTRTNQATCCCLRLKRSKLELMRWASSITERFWVQPCDNQRNGSRA